eukprot:gene6399-7664_t
MAFVTNWKDDAGLTRNVFQEDQQNAFVHRGPRIYSDIGVVVGELDPRPQHHDTRREHFGGVKISAEELAERSRIPVTTEERWTAFLESILSDLVFAPKQILTFLFPPPKPKLKYRSLEEHRKEGLREKAEQDLGSWYNSVMNKAEAHAIVAEYDEAVRLMNDKGYEDLPLPEELPKPGAPWNKWDEYEPETTSERARLELSNQIATEALVSQLKLLANDDAVVQALLDDEAARSNNTAAAELLRQLPFVIPPEDISAVLMRSITSRSADEDDAPPPDVELESDLGVLRWLLRETGIANRPSDGTMQTWVVQERWGQHGAQSAANLSAQLRQFNQLQLLGQLQLVPRQEGSAAHQVVHDALEYLSYDPAAVASAFSIFAAETNPNRSEVLPVSANSTSDGSMNLNSSLAASRAVPAAESSAAPEGASDADRAMLGAATGGLAFALWDLEETAAVVMGVQVLLTQLRQLARSSDAEKIFNSDEQRIAELADSGGYQAPDAVMWVLSQLPRLALSDVSRLRGMLQHHHQKTGASVVRGLLHAILEWEVERLQGRSSEAGSLEAEIRATTHVDPEELEGAAHDLEAGTEQRCSGRSQGIAIRGSAQ